MASGLVFVLPKTAGRSEMRQSILDYIKTFVTNIDAVRQLEVTIRKRDLDISCEDFTIYFSSTRMFKMGFMTEKEKALKTINSIMNEVFEKLNDREDRKAKSEIGVISMVSRKMNKKSMRALISRLVNKETLKGLKYQGVSFKPTRMRLMAEKKANKGERKRAAILSIAGSEEGNVLELDLFHIYKDRFPADMVSESIKDSKKLFEEVLATLARDK